MKWGENVDVFLFKLMRSHGWNGDYLGQMVQLCSWKFYRPAIHSPVLKLAARKTTERAEPLRNFHINKRNVFEMNLLSEILFTCSFCLANRFLLFSSTNIFSLAAIARCNWNYFWFLLWILRLRENFNSECLKRNTRISCKQSARTGCNGSYMSKIKNTCSGRY